MGWSTTWNEAVSAPGLDPGATDGALLRAAADGDQEACRRLVARHAGRIYSVVERVHGDLAETEDVVQESFLKALRCADRYREGGSFFAWMLRIALRIAQDRRRSRTRRQRREEAQELPHSSPGPFERLARSQAQGALRQALASLEPRRREVLVLRYFEQLSVTELAAVYRKSPEAMRKELQRARAHLKAALGPDFEEV